MAKKSRWVESQIKPLESFLDSIRDLIMDKGETSAEVQKDIDEALDTLSGWYEMRDMFN
ncbi:hypothetical protein GCM10027423_44580 [Spirosoma arcticum]